jgi:hypothetical protein
MAPVVCVHGIGQQVGGEDSLLKSWWPALADGLRRAQAGGLVAQSEVAIAFYGDEFRAAGQMLAVGDPPYGAADVEEGFERELLAAWWRSASETDVGVVPPDAVDTLVATPGAGLRALSGSRFFANVALRAMVADLKQVRRYLLDRQARERIRGRVLSAIEPETRVIVAHSLGSVVAYEALCAMPEHDVRALVTLGSPLGIRHLVFDRLRPAPNGSGRFARGVWPGGGELQWTNLADAGDVVAVVKDLRPVFGDRVRSALVHNGAHAHDATSYLTDALCGAAIAAGLK